jgi:DNA-binding XRE family transcriptional regulator
MNEETIHWKNFVIELREMLDVNQFEMAAMLDVDQASISRWERGLALPQHEMKRRMIDLGKNVGMAMADDPLNMVRFSPFPVCLFDKNAMVIAASGDSTFCQSLELLAQVREEEKEGINDFLKMLVACGFWSLHCKKLDTEICLGGEMVRVVAIPLIISGDVYCLLNKVIDNDN